MVYLLNCLVFYDLTFNITCLSSIMKGSYDNYNIVIYVIQ